MADTTQLYNSSNTMSTNGIEMDEFLPIIRLKNPSKHTQEGVKLSESEEEVNLSKHLDDDKRKYKLLVITTKKNEIKATFTIKEGGSSSWDEDGIVKVQLSPDEKNVKVSPESFNAKYNSELELTIKVEGEEKREFYIDFYANDDKEDWNIGEYQNVLCGRVLARIIKLKKVYYAISLMNETDYRSGNLKYYKKYIKKKNDGFGSAELGNYLSTESENLANDTSSEYSGEEIRFLAIFSHGVQDTIWGDGDSIEKSQLSSIFSSKSIHFSGDAVIFLGACNAGTGLSSSFAQELANVTGAEVIGMADDGVAPVKESGGRTSSPVMSYGPKMGKNSIGKFYKFIKGTSPTEIGQTVDIVKLLNTQKSNE